MRLSTTCRTCAWNSRSGGWSNPTRPSKRSAGTSATKMRRHFAGCSSELSASRRVRIGASTVCRPSRGRVRQELSPMAEAERYRHVLIALAVLAVIPPLGAGAQPIPVVAYVANRDASAERVAAFMKGLADRGYVEG